MKARIVKQSGLGYYGEAFYKPFNCDQEVWLRVTTNRYTKLGAYLALRKWKALQDDITTIVKEFEL